MNLIRPHPRVSLPLAEISNPVGFADPLVGVEGSFGTILADPTWRFTNSTGKVAPEHQRLSRYRTMALTDIKSIPVQRHAAAPCHLYLWTPNALLAEALAVMAAWDKLFPQSLSLNRASVAVK
jgi:N6-adenosine-specific RNA methylase IME4